MACAAGSNYCNTTITFDPATNHITTSGYSYDAAGNLLQDGTGTGTVERGLGTAGCGTAGGRVRGWRVHGHFTHPATTVTISGDSSASA